MIKCATKNQLPTDGLWLRFIVLIPVALVLILAAYMHIRSVCALPHRAWVWHQKRRNAVAFAGGARGSRTVL